jgi:hypothetical protein
MDSIAKEVAGKVPTRQNASAEDGKCMKSQGNFRKWGTVKHVQFVAKHTPILMKETTTNISENEKMHQK